MYKLLTRLERLASMQETRTFFACCKLYKGNNSLELHVVYDVAEKSVRDTVMSFFFYGWIGLDQCGHPRALLHQRDFRKRRITFVFRILLVVVVVIIVHQGTRSARTGSTHQIVRSCSRLHSCCFWFLVLPCIVTGARGRRL